ncbi:hypothetical protein, partial [Streptobacillus moniliformis]|uniref:hypothetical protein n=1 Tax=Streptobacillus moniliformis TaxID=34105 RepID=UPI000B247A67
LSKTEASNTYATKQEVDEKIATKADESKVTELTEKVNTVEETAKTARDKSVANENTLRTKEEQSELEKTN